MGATNPDFCVNLVRPSKVLERFPIWSSVDSQLVPDFKPRYSSFPLVALVVDSGGIPQLAPTLFLAGRTVSGHGVTGDTPRTYAESLISWLQFVKSRRYSILTVDELVLKEYRADLAQARVKGELRFSRATVSLRVTVAVCFHSWCQRNGYGSPLGVYLQERRMSGERSLAPRKSSNHPQILSYEEIARLLALVRNPYRLAFRWGLVTGMRRMEVSNLLISDIPSPEQFQYCEDDLVLIKIVRKGGNELGIYVPLTLLEETQWYVHSERPIPTDDCSNYVFLNRLGRQLSRGSVSKVFRQHANEIGSSATLHHLRHTFAVNVLKFLESPDRKRKEARNSLKTLQVLLGHARAETTEIYLEACEATGDDVVEALAFLYGASL